MPASFSKSATYKNISYLPPDHTDGITEYVAGDHSGQRFAIYYPPGSPGDYPVNRAHPTTWAYIVHCVNTSFNQSLKTWADGQANTIDYNSGATSQGLGVAWQCLMNGIAVVAIQVTTARDENGATAPDTGATVPTGNGLFHAPGGTAGYYESLDRPSAKKDMVLACQHLQFFAAKYGLCKDAWGMISTSGGSDTQAWCGLAPSRAMELGSWGPYLENTVPNVFLATSVVVYDWNYGDQSLGGTNSLHWPAAESGTGDDAWTTVGGTPARYRREASAWHFISDRGARCIPPTWLWTAVDSANVRYGPPFTTNTEAQTHSIFQFMALKQAHPDLVRVYGTSDASTTDNSVDVSAYMNGILADVDGDAAAEVARGNADSAIEHILRHINAPRWDVTIPATGIARRGQVNSTGSFRVPSRDGRPGVLLECMSRPERGEASLRWGNMPGSTQGVLRAGESKVLPGGAPLWLSAAGDSTKVARFTARELATL